MAPTPRQPLSPTAHPRFLTAAVTVLHVAATLLVLYEMDLQHYQVAKKQLITENFDEYLTLPTEGLKSLAVDSLYGGSPTTRAAALSRLHEAVDGLLREPETPVYRFVLRAPDGALLLDRADARKPGRLENWSNRLFLTGFSGFVDMRLPPPGFAGGRNNPVGRLQAYYSSPIGKEPITLLTRRYQAAAVALVLLSVAIYVALYRHLLRPMESVSLQLDAGQTGPPGLIPGARSLLETGYNRMATQALLQQLDQTLEPLLQPSVEAQEVGPALAAAMEFLRTEFYAAEVAVCRYVASETAAGPVEVFRSPDDSGPGEEMRQGLAKALEEPGSPHVLAEGGVVCVALALPGQVLAAAARLGRECPDPALYTAAMREGVMALVRPLAAASAIRQELFRRSREANIVLSRNLGHDLTNIIATAKLDLAVVRQLLEGDVSGLSPRKMDILRQSARALLNTNRFLQEVVNIYRAFSFLKRPIRERIDVAAMVAEFLDAFRPSVSTRVDIRSKLPGEPLIATLETRLVKLSLFNLMQNALDAMKRRPDSSVEEPGVIEIRLRREGGGPDGGGTVVLEVEDNGPGICGPDGEPLAPAAIPAIFGFGYSTKDREVNEGLGLAWVRTIVEEFHGGSITAENVGTGGALFRIRIPDPGPETVSPAYRR